MAYKGFEAAYFFTSLLLNNPDDFMSHINDNKNTVFHKYNFQPVYLDKQNTSPDYFENNHLFIMQILNGEIDREW